MMKVEYVTTKIQREQPSVNNINKFLKQINSPFTISFLKQLSEKPQTYTELMVAMGYSKQKNESGRFAYHIRKLMRNKLIQLDLRSKQYFLPFRGIKAFELLQSIDKIVNLSVSSVEDAQTKLIVDLTKNEGWLRPLIQSEIRLAVEQLTKKGKRQS